MSTRVTDITTRTTAGGGLEAEIRVQRAGLVEFHDGELPNLADVPADIREALAAWLNGADR